MTCSRMRFLVVSSIVVCWVAIVVRADNQTEAPAATEEQKPVAAALYGADAEQKANDDGYDFFSIDQLFMNNPQYAKLLSDLQAHTFGSNWRRKRDVGDEEPSAETPVDSPEDTSPTSPIAEITEVTKDMRETTKETSETVENIEGRTTPLKASSSISTTTTSSFGFSGSTERTSEEPTSAAPIRSSTPRRLVHKNNKTKNKNTNNKNTQNKQPLDLPSTLTATNVNKFTVTNSPSATSPLSQSSPLSSSVSTAGSTSSAAITSTLTTNPASSSSNMAAAAAAVANATGGNNKDKVGRSSDCFLTVFCCNKLLIQNIFGEFWVVGS